MKSSWWYRFIFLTLAFVLAGALVLPTAMNFDPEGKFPVKSRIGLGLDLQGGLYMILGIDFKKVYRDEITTYSHKIETLLKDRGISSRSGELDEGDGLDPRHSIVLEQASDIEKSKEEIKRFFGSYIRLTNEEGTTLQYGLGTSVRKDIEEQSVSKSIEVIRNRIDEFGVAEPEIISQGKDRIVVQLPGIKDIERAKDLIGKTAKLEFRMVNDSVAPVTIQEWLDKAEKEGITYKKGERFSNYLFSLNTFLRKDMPEGYELAFERRISQVTNEAETSIPYLVESNVPLSGEQIQDAQVQIDQQKNEPYVSLEFKSAGAKIFEDLTAASIGKRMAVVLDGNVYSAPVIQAKIGGGRAQITMGGGGFNKVMKESRDLALVLRAGALPVQLDFLEQRSVGPSLGQDAIEKARIGGLVGCIAVFIFMFIYYRVSGVIAVVTLTLNVLIILAFLVSLEATLTLPGIAGIALTVGMAVDGNIIIYERIREEIRKGLNFYKAVENGFSQAFWTILDANITTALAGLCLLNFGTGPIRGFAVTLLIGIVATIYTSYFVSKLLFELYLNKTEGQDLSI
jgi:protein-export membrane protein SecD